MVKWKGDHEILCNMWRLFRRLYCRMFLRHPWCSQAPLKRPPPMQRPRGRCGLSREENPRQSGTIPAVHCSAPFTIFHFVLPVLSIYFFMNALCCSHWFILIYMINFLYSYFAWKYYVSFQKENLMEIVSALTGERCTAGWFGGRAPCEEQMR